MEIPSGYFSAPTPTAKPRPGSVNETAVIARTKARLLRAAEDTLDEHGFTQVFAPTLTQLSGACGEPGTLIPVDVHGTRAYLRQTSQLHLEPLMRDLGKVYSIGRSFRAERHADDRHLTEFTLIEAEAAGWTLPQLMDLMEGYTAPPTAIAHSCVP